MPRFSSFDDAWRWFSEDGRLITVEEQRAALTGGRAQYLSFQAGLAEDDAAIDAYESLLEQVADIGGIVPQPRELLHITIRPAGFQVIAKTRDDELLRQDVPRMAEKAAHALRESPVIPVTIGPPAVFPDALVLEIHDGGGLAEIRRALAAVTPRVDAAAEEMPFLPHLSVAWFGSADIAPRLHDALAPLREAPPVETVIRRIELARYWFTGTGPEDEAIDLDVIRSYRLRA